MKKRFRKSFLSMILIFALVLCLAPNSYGARSLVFSDIQGHWSQTYILKAVNYGIVNGYENGTFRPDKSVTRAEFCTMVNNAFRNDATSEISFSDINKFAWYYDNVAKGVRACYVQGYEDNTFRPERTISRQEAAVIAMRLVPYNTSSKSLYHYADMDKIQSWAYGSMQQALAAGYITPRSDGLLHPEDALTRAEATKILCDIVDSKNLTIEKTDENIKTNKTVLKDTIYTNGLTIDKNLGEGKVTLKNCVVLGTLNIKGGGTNSIYLENSRIASCVVDKAGSEVRVVASGNSIIFDTEVKNKAILEEEDLAMALSNAGYNIVKIAENAIATLKEGNFPKVLVTGKAGQVMLDNSSISDLRVEKNAADSAISVPKNSRIISATASAPTTFLGAGRVSALYVNSKGVTYETRPANVFVAEEPAKDPEKKTLGLTPIMNPSNEATNISLDKTITLTFSQPIEYYNGKSLTPALLADAINLNAKKANGAAVPFTASINKDATIITIVPRDGLVKKTKYYLTIYEAEFRDEKENYNAEFTAMFTTGDGSKGGVTWKPADGTQGAGKTAKPTITFANPIEAYDGKTGITPSYLKKNIVFRKLDEFVDEEEYEDNGKAVSFTAEINKKMNGITITPKAALEDGGKYYLAFKNKAFRYADTGEALEGQYVVFTVGYLIPSPEFTPKDGTQFYGNSKDIKIVFADRLSDSAGKELTGEYIKNNVIFADNTANTKVAFTANVSTTKEKTTITLDPVSLLADGHEYTVTLPDKIFKSSGNKPIGMWSTSFTSASTTPNIDALSATATTTQVTVKLKANMKATAYIKVVPQSTTLTKASDVKNGAVSVSTIEGETIEVNIPGTYIGGDTYKVYAVMETGSKTTDISQANATVTKDIAKATRIEVRGTTQSGRSFSQTQNVQNDVAKYNFTLPFGTANAYLCVTAPSGHTVTSDLTGSGSSFEGGSISGNETSFSVTPLDVTRDMQARLKVSATRCTDSSYTVVMRIAGDTSISSLAVAGSVGTLGSGDTYILPGGTSTAQITITATDPHATITCNKLSPSVAGTGTLTGDVVVPNNASTTPLEITYQVKSNQDVESYTIYLQTLQ